MPASDESLQRVRGHCARRADSALAAEGAAAAATATTTKTTFERRLKRLIRPVRDFAAAGRDLRGHHAAARRCPDIRGGHRAAGRAVLWHGAGGFFFSACGPAQDRFGSASCRCAGSGSCRPRPHRSAAVEMGSGSSSSTPGLGRPRGICSRPGAELLACAEVPGLQGLQVHEASVYDFHVGRGGGARSSRPVTGSSRWPTTSEGNRERRRGWSAGRRRAWWRPRNGPHAGKTLKKTAKPAAG